MTVLQKIFAGLVTFFSFQGLLFAAEPDKAAQATGVLFAAYVGVWIVTLILVIRTGLKASNVDKGLKHVQQELDDLEKRMDKAGKE